ncbi:hypothetical protein J7L67_02880 [bacterium]|nr:hypothetical protein [bacterium]
MFYAFFMIGALDKSEKKYFLSLPALKYIAVFFILLLFLMFKRVANYIDAQAYFNAAHYIFNEQKNPNKALEYLHQARKRDKDNSAIDFLAGSIYLSGNHIEDAIINFKKAVKDNPYRAAYHYHLARALALSGSRKNKEKAMFEFSEALSYNPLRIEYQKAYDQYKKDFLSYENTGS